MKKPKLPNQPPSFYLMIERLNSKTVDRVVKKRTYVASFHSACAAMLIWLDDHGVSHHNRVAIKRRSSQSLGDFFVDVFQLYAGATLHRATLIVKGYGERNYPKAFKYSE